MYDFGPINLFNEVSSSRLISSDEGEKIKMRDWLFTDTSDIFIKVEFRDFGMLDTVNYLRLSLICIKMQHILLNSFNNRGLIHAETHKYSL